MKLALVAVGRLKPGPLLALFQDYAGRLSWPLTLTEVEERRPLSAAELKAREGALILTALDTHIARLTHPAVVALDEHGSGITSLAFARRLENWRDEGRDALFVIGGAGGLARPVLERAEWVLSFGPMTWPHQIARMLLAEQLFRAQSILAGHPYHRE